MASSGLQLLQGPARLWGLGSREREATWQRDCVTRRYSPFDASLPVLNFSGPTFQGWLKGLELLVHISVIGFLQGAIFSVHHKLDAGYYTAACILSCSNHKPDLPGNLSEEGCRPAQAKVLGLSGQDWAEWGCLLQDFSERLEIFQQNTCFVYWAQGKNVF